MPFYYRDYDLPWIYPRMKHRLAGFGVMTVAPSVGPQEQGDGIVTLVCNPLLPPRNGNGVAQGLDRASRRAPFVRADWRWRAAISRWPGTINRPRAALAPMIATMIEPLCRRSSLLAPSGFKSLSRFGSWTKAAALPLVGAARFELATFCSQSRRAARLRYAPAGRPSSTPPAHRPQSAP